jgi:hypothetical protein
LEGVAVANPTWDVQAWEANTTTMDRPFYYNDSSSPVVSTSLWSTIVSSKGNDTKSLVYNDPTTSEAYLVIWQLLDLTNGRTGQRPSYVSVSTFPLAKINAPIETIGKEMSDVFIIYAIISVSVFVTVLSIVMVATMLLANVAIKPLEKLSKESERISNNIGKESIFENVGSADTLSRDPKGLRNRLNRINETDELHRQFYKMISTMRKTPTNVFYSNPTIPRWNPDKIPKAVRDQLPNTPNEKGPRDAK